jgi:hypothetical protein
MVVRKFEKGRCYFLVGYLDRQFKLPFIQSYVFVGTESPAAGDRWVFQDVHSFSKYGECHESDESKGIDVMLLDQDGLDTMLDSEALAEEFTRLGI